MGQENKESGFLKELTEGQAIALAVLAIAGLLTALVYLGQFLLDYFFPNF